MRTTRGEPPLTPKVFISYRHVMPDEDCALQLCALLERESFDVFIDKRILVGRQWVEEGGCRLKRRKGVHFARRLRQAVAAHERGERSTAEIGSMVRGWINHVRHGRTLGLRRVVLATCRVNARQGTS